MKTPYYAVIFTSKLKASHTDQYADWSRKMVELARIQPGFLGIESAREDLGITVSYWKDKTSILQWKQNTEHLMAQKLGRDLFYRYYHVRIARVEREYYFNKDEQ